MRRFPNNRGFNLMELMVAITIAALALTMGMTGLGKARTAGNSRGLATAVASEFRHAREKAIASGSPVAVVLPNGVGRSMFWLEGTTDPVVTRVQNFEGDYPRGTITVATYTGPSYNKNATMPGFKADVWNGRLDSWLPDKYKEDFVFVFTPNGSVISNDLPAAKGIYGVIVSTGADITGASAPSGGKDWVGSNNGIYFRLLGAGEPQTVALSLSGAVEQYAGLYGWDGAGVNTQGGRDVTAPKPPNPQVDYTAKIPKIVSHNITPPAEMVDGQMVHVLDKGEYLTLEVFAHSGDGKPIFASWKDTPVTRSGDDFKGRFSVPNGAPERMEFFPEFDINGDGVIRAADDELDVWRSVWTWTPPRTAQAGDRYKLGVDVKDAKDEFQAQIPNIPPVDVAPPGEIAFERMVGGNWHIFTMWADGSRMKQITDGPGSYTCPSATSDGKVIAFQHNANEVWVMNSDGTGAVKIAQGILPAISPTGSSIAYMNEAHTQVWVRRLDSSGAAAKIPVTTSGTAANSCPTPANRMAYSPDGRTVFYTRPGGQGVNAVHISFTGNSLSLGAPVLGQDIPNDPSGSQVGGVYCGRTGDFVYYHGDINDPYIGRYPLDGNFDPEPIGSNIRVSVGQLETYPAPSPDGSILLFCQQVGGVQQIFSCPMGAFAASGTERQLTFGAASRRPFWVNQRG